MAEQANAKTLPSTDLTEYFSAIGCSAFNARNWIRQRGGFPPEFRSIDINPDTGELDQIHGSEAYYRALVKEVFRVHSIPCPVSDLTCSTE